MEVTPGVEQEGTPGFPGRRWRKKGSRKAAQAGLGGEEGKTQGDPLLATGLLLGGPGLHHEVGRGRRQAVGPHIRGPWRAQVQVTSCVASHVTVALVTAPASGRFN